jgi:hypothetical protein
MKFLGPYMGILHPQELCTKQLMYFSRVRVLTLLVLKNRYGVDQQVTSIIHVSVHVDDCLICKSVTVMVVFKQDPLSRFVGTDEGEVTEYLSCEIIRDREAKTEKIVQSGYFECVLENFWHMELEPRKDTSGC